MTGSGMEPTELPGGHTARLLLYHDVYRKIWREKRRFEGADDFRDRTDAFLNFCISAWHFSDWLWHRDPSAMRELAALDPKKDGLKQFQRWVARTFPALSVCDVIANAAKHGGRADEKPGRPHVETLLIARPRSASPSVEVLANDLDKILSLSLLVNGRREQGPAFVNRAFSDCTRLRQRADRLIIGKPPDR